MPIAALSEAIEDSQLERWQRRLSGYRDAPTKAKIKAWLRRFELDDQSVAAKLLDNTFVISERAIQQGYRSALGVLPGWNVDEKQRVGRWVFVGWGGAGESGLAMLRLFREANGLTAKRHDSLFKTPAEVPALQLTARDHLIFVDDFSGTGRQICNSWEEMKFLIGVLPTIFLVLTAATEAAVTKIEQCSQMTVVSRYQLRGKRLLFGDQSPMTVQERAVLVKYGRVADRNRPKGYGDCGLAVGLSHKTPNNCLPVLYANKQKWRGLLPRDLKGV